MAQPFAPTGQAVAGRPELPAAAARADSALHAYLLARETLRRVKPTATPCFAVDADERRRRQQPRHG
ncbi:MAG TPA: hypothetical protein VF453_19150 [Burkholderiaceae bacterium]